MKTEPFACLTPEVLSQYLRGELPDAQADEIENHLESCTNCISTIGREVDKDAFCKTVLDSGKHRANLTATVDRVAKLKASLEPLWPDNIEAPTAESASTVDPAPEASTPSVLPSAPRLESELGWVDDYRILAEIGRGGMGVVYRAEDRVLSRQVAIKMIKPRYADDDRFRQRFLREARAMAAVSHDNIVPIYHVGGETNPYFVMPLLRGRSLEDRLEAGQPLTAAEVLRIGSQIANGLTAAHYRGLVHRDLKPGNLWLDEKENVQILDFGLARFVDGNPSTVPAGGTPKYMSPEQERGLEVTFSTDLYSLGVVLYRLGTRQFPQGEASLSSSNAKNLRDEGFPEPAVRTIMQMLDPEPSRRPVSAHAVARALGGGSKRRWWPPLAAAAVVLVGIGGLVPFLLPEPDAPVFSGHLDVVLRVRDGKDIVTKNDRLLGDPDFLEIRDGDRGHFDMEIEQGPKAFFYLIQIDTNGAAEPMFPESWKWDNLPSAGQETSRKSVRLPGSDEKEFQNAKSGLASYLWLVREKRLTAEHHQRLKEILTVELRWKQPDDLKKEVFLFQNGKLTQARDRILSEHPVRQTETALLKIKNENLAAYSRAICYLFVKP